MSRAALFAGLALLALTGQAQTAKLELPALAPVAEPEKEGRALAEKLTASVPVENMEFRGTLKIRRRDRPVELIPLTSRITIHSARWEMFYATEGTTSQAAQTLRVEHAPGRTNRYFLAAGESGERELSRAEIAQPLGGSDYWYSELGLEFLHWPGQRLTKREMRMGRPCHVLESTLEAAPAPGAYGRVVSWIDIESGGLLMAEASDPAGKLVKEFEVEKLEKVNGQWQVKRMEIRSSRAGSRTWIEFQFETPKPR